MTILLTILIIILLFILVVVLFMRRPEFGAAPTGARLQRMQASPNYTKGQFQNIHYTPQLAEGHSMLNVLYHFLFKKSKRARPAKRLPSVKTNLSELPLTENMLVWFGHSSYYMQLDGKRFLVDPVLSGSASPIPGGSKSFPGSDIYTVNDFPPLDYLVISHDHYDHLDYKTVVQLKEKVTKVICGLGVGAHLGRWGYSPDQLIELDRNEAANLEPGFTLHTTTARHFSGRSFKRNSTLWLSYVLQTPSLKIFIGGDSGYDTHFAEIGKQFGPFDWAIIENGQYNEAWHYIHMLPGEGLRAAKDLQTKNLLTVHHAKFVLANHDWDEPLRTISEECADDPSIRLATPMIGEPLYLSKEDQVFEKWWEEVG
ncbi:MAG: MBL fold metallo-hydrolase [Filimonas sp.]|nr:MBL fold metallo-hydrolase [Filimonas sp.]